VTNTQADADLLRMHADGDRDAFSALYQRHCNWLWRVAARIAGPQDADDAVQDGMVKAYRRAADFRGDSAVTSWLYRIVTNAALDITRRRPVVADDAGEDRPHANPRTAMTDVRLDMRQQWRRISAEHRQALLLIDVMDYSVADAARILAVSEGTLKSRAARGRRALAARLAHLAVAG
jgi:RNA polymerase sigma-70 factor, ECF subfamily